MQNILWSDASVTHYSFLNRGETITSVKYCQQIEEMHKKFHVYICRLLMERDKFIFLMCRLCTTDTAEVERRGIWNSPVISPTDHYFFKHIGNLHIYCFKNQNAFNNSVASRIPEFHSSGINKLVPHWQKQIDYFH